MSKWISVKDRKPEPGAWFVGIHVEKIIDFRTNREYDSLVLVRGWPPNHIINSPFEWWIELPDPTKLGEVVSEGDKLPSPAKNDYFYPTLCSMVDRDAAEAIHILAKYVRPGGDWALVRSHLDMLDRAFGEIEGILRHKYNGHIWNKR